MANHSSFTTAFARYNIIIMSDDKNSVMVNEDSKGKAEEDYEIVESAKC